MVRSTQSRQKPMVFLDYLSRKVQAERPEYLEKTNHVLDLYHRQQPGYKSLSTVMNHVNQIIGEEYWGKVYHEFMAIWTQVEQRRAGTAVGAHSNGDVIDLTSTSSENDSATEVTAAADSDEASPPESRSDATMQLLSQVASMQLKQQPPATASTAASRRMMPLPIASRPPGPPFASLEDTNPFGPLPVAASTPTRAPARKKAPPPTDHAKQRHFALMTQIQKQVKDETARAMVFVHNTLGNLQKESPTTLYPKACAIVEDVLMRSQQREIGYEIVAGLIVERLKTLITVGESPISSFLVPMAPPVASLVLDTSSKSAESIVTAPLEYEEEMKQPAESRTKSVQAQPKKKLEKKQRQQQTQPQQKQQQLGKKMEKAAVAAKAKADLKKTSAPQNQDAKRDATRKRKAENQAAKPATNERKGAIAATNTLKRRMVAGQAAGNGDKLTHAPRSPSSTPPSRAQRGESSGDKVASHPQPRSPSSSPPKSKGSKDVLDLQPRSPSSSPPPRSCNPSRDKGRDLESDTDSFGDSSDSDSDFDTPKPWRARNDTNSNTPWRQCELVDSSSSDEELSPDKRTHVTRQRAYSDGDDSSSGDEEEIPLSPSGSLMTRPRESQKKPAAKPRIIPKGIARKKAPPPALLQQKHGSS